MKETVRYCAKSATGMRRPDNQDRTLTTRLAGGGALLAVADGMGGAAAGGLAAEIAVRYLENAVSGQGVRADILAETLTCASREIASFSQADASLDGMGTTLTVVAVHDGTASWAHVGDSRLYHLGAGGLRQISRDHRFLQDLIDCGDVTLAELPGHPLRNVLDQCLGCPGVRPDRGSFAVSPRDLLLLTSDGVHDHVTPDRMAELLLSAMCLEDMAGALIAEARRAGSTDDLSAVLCRVV